MQLQEALDTFGLHFSSNSEIRKLRTPENQKYGIKKYEYLTQNNAQKIHCSQYFFRFEGQYEVLPEEHYRFELTVSLECAKGIFPKIQLKGLPGDDVRLKVGTVLKDERKIASLAQRLELAVKALSDVGNSYTPGFIGEFVGNEKKVGTKL